MKRIILVSLCYLAVNVCNGQEWFSSFDVAKRLARVQNKMLFVIWEETFNYSIPVLVKTDSAKVFAVDLSKDTRLDSVILEYFIPLKLSELEYTNFIKAANGRGSDYINKLNDDSIKIMDVNGNILNTRDYTDGIMNFSLILNKYALNTSYLRSELDNYFEENNFLTTSLLALKYVDFAIFVQEGLRPEIMALANIYLDESKKYLAQMEDDKRETYLQKIELVRIKQLIILNQPKKASRQIKRFDASQIDTMNESLFVFINYTVLKLLNDEINADTWKSKISSLDLKKIELILKNNKSGSTN